MQLNLEKPSEDFENNYHINKLEKGLIENSELFRIDNLIEQSQNKNSWLIISTSILDKEL